MEALYQLRPWNLNLSGWSKKETQRLIDLGNI